ncbi:MAG: molecular chaperone HtpG [Waddliaceae bacterium]|jgi:molecular chaperone HtpG|nr:molecular chaperone HtpG [Waddliaceae bacterium]MBT3578702.1 molecular chaperone HtpG [Waddliaceae bacterium]MBT6928311.1 molecular chaperone HtpG [Waddliaceae bacterium]MBT7264997.1 molecular chaperone HtpG [Waddliaceae bacterium]MBT7462046.1 molecular chaperone HtpG [Waddliaceae bacterium]
MTTKKLQIHSENILPIIKRWLYSDKDIFVRELVSNACDAIHKVKVIADKGEASSQEHRIDITVDKEKRTLIFSDTGIGMDAEEVDTYIAQLAFSGAEEFIKKYQSNEEKDQIIGHFGLGFYSAFMVSEKVEIDTLSYKKDAEAVLWECDGGVEYTTGKGKRKEQGTTITLHVDKDNEEYLEEPRIKGMLEKYCAFLPYPIYLNDTHINAKEPLWIKNAADCTDDEYREFYRQLYPFEQEPLFWVHLNVDYPFNLRGILYFPKVKRDYDFRKNNIKLFCNRVFVNDDCKDLIPEYLTVLRGAIDSPDIPLNVSRSCLQMDRTVRQLSGHIAKKVSDKLATLYKTDKEKFIASWSDVEIIVKLGAMEDDKFYKKIKEFLIWKNTDGEWGTVEEYIEKNKDKNDNKVFYTSDAKHNAHVLDIYREKGIEVLNLSSMIDTHLINFLEGHIAPAKFQRIDAGIVDAIIDTSKEKTVLDADGKTESVRLQEYVSSKLDIENVEVTAKSLATESIPAMITIDEDQRRFRDYMRVANPGDIPAMPVKQSFVVNTNNALMKAIQELESGDEALTKNLIAHLYESTLLAQHELDSAQLTEYVVRSNAIIEKLAKKSTGAK